MVGIEQEPNCELLKGIELTQMRASRNGVEFIFTEGPSIKVSDAFEHYDTSTKTTTRYEIGAERQPLTANWLLNVYTTSVEITPHDVLRLSFTNGDTLSMTSWTIVESR